MVALADAFDAMTSDRPYRKGMLPAMAFAEIEKQIGRQFDPTFAAAFLAMQEAILKEMNVQASVLTPSKRSARPVNRLSNPLSAGNASKGSVYLCLHCRPARRFGIVIFHLIQPFQSIYPI